MIQYINLDGGGGRRPCPRGQFCLIIWNQGLIFTYPYWTRIKRERIEMKDERDRIGKRELQLSSEELAFVIITTMIQ